MLNVLVGFLGVGLICNLAVRPVAASLFVAPPASAARARASEAAAAFEATPPGEWGLVGVAWILVALPLGWGVLKTLTLASQMFR